MSLLLIAEVRALVKTALDDAQLQRVINREEAEVVKHFGAHYDGSSIAETHPGGGRSIFLRRGITSVSSVTERYTTGDSPVTLGTDDYFTWADEGRIERLQTGTKWGAVVVVSYIPKDDSVQRRQVLIELVRLAIERTAMQSESVAGEYSYQAGDWEVKRAELIRKLGFWRA